MNTGYKKYLGWLAGLLLLTQQAVFSAEDYAVRPASGLDFTVHPFVEFSANYDSNAMLDDKGAEQSDMFFDAVLGANGRLSSGHNSLGLGGWRRTRIYSQNSRINGDDWGINLDANLGNAKDFRRRIRVKPRIEISRTIDYNGNTSDYSGDTTVPEEQTVLPEQESTVTPATPDREWQNNLLLGADADGPLTDKTDFGLGGAYTRTVFDRTDLLSPRTKMLGGRLAYNVTDRSAVTLTGGFTDLENNHLTAQNRAIRVGLRRLATDKLSTDTGVGIHSFSADDADLDRGGVSYHVAARWRYSAKTTMTLRGLNSMELAEDEYANAREVNTVDATLRNQITQRWCWDLGAGYRHEDYILHGAPAAEDRSRTEVPGGTRPYRDWTKPHLDRKTEQWLVRLGTDYRVNRYASLRASATYEDTQDNVIDNYDQFRLSLALRLVY